MNLDAPLSPHFTLRELLRSDTAERDPSLNRYQLNPPQAVLDGLTYLCATTIQPIRDRLGVPLRINSGYRCPEVNTRVGGSRSSQHVLGQAADIELEAGFLADDRAAGLRREVEAGVLDRCGRPLRASVNANFYLFAYVCLHMDELDIDQVIHEYGPRAGEPAWCHAASSAGRSSRQILAVGSYTNKQYRPLSVRDALALGT